MLNGGFGHEGSPIFGLGNFRCTFLVETLQLRSLLPSDEGTELGDRLALRYGMLSHILPLDRDA